jgi:hypothetical protein
MSSPKITTIEQLQEYLRIAMQIEHATIPPYLLALYSIHPGTNSVATQALRVVVVEEMLHLTLAANLLNAVGGKPDLTAPDFVPLYPAFLPNGEKDFEVDLQPFSPAAIDTFLKIERPGRAPSEDKRMIHRPPPMMLAAAAAGVRRGTRIRTMPRSMSETVPQPMLQTTSGAMNAAALAAGPGDSDLDYYTIGEFYDEISRGLKYLYEKEKDKLFSGAAEKQAGPEYYYSGGAALIEVTNLQSALDAVNVIIEQGEGFDRGVYNDAGEIAHYFRFKELEFGQHYQNGDTPDRPPTGEKFTIDWNAVYPFKKNSRLTDYAGSSELQAAAVAFNRSYAEFLAVLTAAYNGKPELLLEKAVPQMFVLRNKTLQLIHNPIPGMEGVNAAPTFEMDEAGSAVAA